LVDEEGKLKDAEKALLADSIGTVVGSVLGTSTVTSFVESSSGVEVGGRTGLTACTTGVLFFLSVLISPIILSTATNAVTAPALVVVGILMAQQLGGVNWDDFIYTAAGFVTIIAMILTYSISNGIGVGAITYVLITLFSGNYKKKDIVVTIIAALFVARFLLITM
jgi:AGZA family xanthine/uracil permease-like MFS transporter